MAYKLENLFSKKRMGEFKNTCQGYTHLPGLSAHELDARTIVFSPAFRRLLDKTQVFPLEKYDYVRTRLTHSLEVMTVAEALIAKVSRHFEELKAKKIPLRHIMRCSALLHDLGNPPYGHYGEDVIQAFFQNNIERLELSPELAKTYGLGERKAAKIIGDGLYSDFTGFNGNAQTLRILTSLESIDGKPIGFNLTAAVLGSIVKYPHLSDEGGKFNIFKSERHVSDFLEKEGTLIMGQTNPLALIMEAADDIAYTFSDIDDAVKKELITEADFLRELSDASNSAALSNFNELFDKYRLKNEGKPDSFKVTMQECLNTYRDIAIDCCARAINEFDRFVDLDVNVISLLPSIPNYGQTINDLFIFLNGLMKKYVYISRPIVSNELEGENILKYLPAELTDAVLTIDIDENGNAKRFTSANKKKYFHQEKVYSLISSHIRLSFADNARKYANESQGFRNIIYHRLQLVTDYVSGMTDSYAKMIYKELKAMD